MLYNRLGTQNEIKGVDGNTMGFFWEFGGKAKLPT